VQAVQAGRCRQQRKKDAPVAYSKDQQSIFAAEIARVLVITAKSAENLQAARPIKFKSAIRRAVSISLRLIRSPFVNVIFWEIRRPRRMPPEYFDSWTHRGLENE
jgi:hypothetical protein